MRQISVVILGGVVLLLLLQGCSDDTVQIQPSADLSAEALAAVDTTVSFHLRGSGANSTITSSRIDFDGNGSWDVSRTHNSGEISEEYSATYATIGQYQAVGQILMGSEILATATRQIEIVPPQPLLEVVTVANPAVLIVAANCANPAATVQGWTATLLNARVVDAVAANQMAITSVDISYDWDDPGLNTSGVQLPLSSTIPVGDTAQVSFSPIAPTAITASTLGQNVDLTLVFKGQTQGGVAVEATHTAQLQVEACNPLPPPSGLTATPLGTNSIQLNWVDNSTTEDRFELERSVAGLNSWSQIATPTSPTHTDSSSLQPNESYDYRVRAVQGATNSVYSNTANARTLVSFSANIYPMFTNSPGTCTSCHTGGSNCGANGGLDLSGSVGSVYNEIRNESPPCGGGQRIDVTVPVNSWILRKPAEDGVTHTGGTRWPTTGAEYGRMLLWIEQEANNN